MTRDVKLRGRHREIPWAAVIGFHKEITRRAEEAFFCLPTGSGATARWSGLADFAPADLAGPWSMEIGQINGQGLSRQLRGDGVGELYLGCCGYARWQKAEGRDWQIDWVPSLYRQVDAVLDEHGVVNLIPAQSKWEISPLIYTLLDRKNVVTAQPLETWLPELLEAAAAMAGEGFGLAAAIRDVLAREIPGLGEELMKELPLDRMATPPTDWVLFAPPATTSQFNRHLMADYEALEKHFASPDAPKGGLRLLEDGGTGALTPLSDLLPIVTLDESQRKAVEAILTGQEVTVISGPPGCGKSQVVVSALLNCWANGTSVLFASNNNKAVDVVRERVERFENDFPIAIRAGSRQASNLEEAIRRALNTVSDPRRTPRIDASTSARQEQIQRQQKELQDLLDSQVPQRADQALRSAMSAFGMHGEAVRALQVESQKWERQLKQLGYTLAPERLEELVLKPLTEWLEGIPSAEAEIAANRAAVERIEAAVVVERSRRDRACLAAGMDPQGVHNWGWLLAGPGPEGLATRLEAIKHALSGPIERTLDPGPWDDRFDRWQGSATAKEWGVEALTIVADVRSVVGRLEPTLAVISEARAALTHALESLRQYRVPDGATVSPALLSDWVGVWAEEVTTPPGALDWWPWSRRARRRRQLRRIEAAMRPALPPSVWQQVGPIDSTSRHKLSGLVETLQGLHTAQVNWRGLDSRRKEVEETFSKLRERVSRLSVQAAPVDFDAAAWRTLSDTLAAEAGRAQVAADAWARREQRDQCVQELRSVIGEFESFGAGLPIRESWLSGPGADLYGGLRLLARDPRPETVVSARRAVYSAPFAELTSGWHRARGHEEKVTELAAERAVLVPENEVIARWWRRRPRHLAGSFPVTTQLPKKDDRLTAHLEGCRQFWQGWLKFRDDERPPLEARVAREADWARQQLQSAHASLPQTSAFHAARALVAQVMPGPVEDWPIEALQTAFAALNPESLRAQIAQYHADIQTLAFAFARESWVGKLRANSDLQETLGTLLRQYERNRGAILPADYPLFRRALSALPIWITTAQAPQALPLLPGLFDVLIIDEATQCTLTNLLPLMYRAKRIVVIGDKEQLPAIPTLSEGAELALAHRFQVENLRDLIGHTQNTVYNSLVQCLPHRHGDVVSLSEHYRSHPLIIGFSNEYVYRQRLRLRKDPGSTKLGPSGAGVFSRHVDGQCERGDRNQSWRNRPEALAVVDAIAQLRGESRFTHLTLGVVTPFSAQVALLEELLDRRNLSRGVRVGTAHRFQGDECDIVIFSPVVAKGMMESTAAWVEKPHNLVNVAVTRAREALFFIGDLTACRKQPGVLGRLAEYVDRVELLRQTSQEELDLFAWMTVQGWNPEVHPRIGDMEVDFVVRRDGRKVAIEVDGKQHDATTVADSARDAFLKANGYLTLRLSARAVRETPAVCIERIEKLLVSSADG